MFKRLRLALAVVACAAASATAQAYPDKPVRIVVPFPPGGSVDIVARTVGEALTGSLGQPFVVENRAGASGNIGAAYAAKADPDGYTLLMVSAGVLAANEHLYIKLPFKPLEDFAPVVRIADQPNILMVHPSVPANNVQELIALAKARQLTVGSAGIGTGQDIAAQLFMQQSGVKMLHVPYKGGAPALQDLLGGQIDLMFETSPTALPYVKTGKLKALGITTARRSPLMPDLPTVAEGGLPGYEAITWIGLVAPAGTPQAVVDQLNAAVRKAMDGGLNAKLNELALVPVGDTPADFVKYLKADYDNYARIVKAAGIAPQ